MKNTIVCISAIMLALSSCSTSKSSDATKVALKRGMTQDEVTTALGKPSYKYALNEQETWVYTEGNPRTAKLKSTSLNMVPIAGPVISYVGSRNPKTNAVKAAVVFGKDNKVSQILEAKADAPAAKP